MSVNTELHASMTTAAYMHHQVAYASEATHRSDLSNRRREAATIRSDVKQIVLQQQSASLAEHAQLQAQLLDLVQRQQHLLEDTLALGMEHSREYTEQLLEQRQSYIEDSESIHENNALILRMAHFRDSADQAVIGPIYTARRGVIRIDRLC